MSSPHPSLPRNGPQGTSEDRFRLMVEGSDDIFFFEHDETLQFSYVSPSCRKITGFSMDELLGRALSEFMADETSAQRLTAPVGLEATDQVRRAPFVVGFRHRNGSVISIEIVESYRVEYGRKMTRGFARDITARRTAEQRLELSDQILQRINAIVVVANGQGQIVYITPSASRILGFSAAEMLGYGWWNHEGRSAKDRREACEAIAAAARGDRPYRTEVWEETTYDKAGMPHCLLWQEAKGPRDLLIGIAQDITDKKKVDEELEERRAQLRAIFDNAVEGMFIVNDRFAYVDANPAGCKIYGRTRDEIIGKPVGAFSPPNSLSTDLWRRVRRDGEFVGEHQILRPDGTRIDIEISIKLNIFGYKESRVTFRDLFYQTVGTTGAGDPIQTGAGTAVGSIATTFTGGSTESSGVNTDVAISGDGFFVVEKDGARQYTRAGNFTLDPEGFLTTQDGHYVLCYQAAAGALNPALGLAPIQLGKGQINPPNPTGYLQMKANLNAGAQVGDPPYTSQMVVYDSLGASHALTFQFSKTAANSWNYSITIPAAEVGATGAPVAIDTGSLQFDGNGQLISPTGDITGLTVAGLANGASDLTFDWRLFDGGTGLLTQMASASNVSSSYQDGFSSGSLLDFSIGSDGIVQGSFTNGTKALGQIALANFANLQGLEREGHNCFGATLASGQAVIGAPGTGGRGSLAGGALELSNVDIAREFANLITAQRGFQANARTITAFDEITQETINLKR